jgi:hypothetical protein
MEKLKMYSNQNYDIVLNMPTDLLINSFAFLDITDINYLCLTCKEFNNIGSVNYIWSNYLLKYNIVIDKSNENINFKKIITDKINENIKRKKEKRKELNENILNITNNIFKYNVIFKNIYMKNKTIIDNKKNIDYGKINYLTITKFGNILEDLIKRKILTVDIFVDTLNIYNMIKL